MLVLFYLYISVVYTYTIGLLPKINILTYTLQSAIKIIMFLDRVKEMAVNHPDMKASEILANVEMLMDNPGPLGLKDESLMRSVVHLSARGRGE